MEAMTHQDDNVAAIHKARKSGKSKQRFDDAYVEHKIWLMKLAVFWTALVFVSFTLAVGLTALMPVPVAIVTGAVAAAFTWMAFQVSLLPTWAAVLFSIAMLASLFTPDGINLAVVISNIVLSIIKAIRGS